MAWGRSALNSGSILIFLAGTLLCCQTGSAQITPEFSIHQVGGKPVLSLRYAEHNFWKNLQAADTQWQQLMQVYVGKDPDSIKNSQPAVLGNYEMTGEMLTFTPLFDFQPNINYLAVFNKEHFWHFNINPSQNIPVPEVLQLYPSADTLPANLLKIYLHFTNSMTQGNCYRYIHLLNDQGDTLRGVFLELHPELWDRDGKRLTLWFDPGRVKRELAPNRSFGSPLEPAKSYEIRISRLWRDINGNQLRTPFSKRFFVRSADRQRPNIQNWLVFSPKPFTLDPLIIKFGEPLDAALSHRAILIYGENQQKIAGRPILKQGETEYWFYPASHWLPGPYQVKVASILEDLAGNNLNRLFDRDLREKPAENSEQPVQDLNFELY